MTDVIQKLWGFCAYLRHDGMNYGNYIEQLTYLLFLKMASEKGIKLPSECNWNKLISYSGSELLESYTKILQTLKKEKGILGDIFTSSSSAFNNPANLKKLLNLIDQFEWTSIDIDIKAAAYEGLLEKYAADEKGAGQYFTPRPLIRVIVRCVKPDFTKSSDYTIHDPACGTCGFLIGAFEWIMKLTDDGSKLKDADKIRLVKKTFSGMDNVTSTRRLGLMNCYLHEIEPEIYYGNSLGEGSHVGKRYDLILTNPPFGSAGVGGAPNRDDFLVQTANKQLNFLQHIMTLLKPGGFCAMIVPDGVLFSEHGEKIREHFLNTCNLDIILRLPEGTFSPYSPGTKANVMFFSKGNSTKEFWIYDLRTNIEKIRKKKPLKEDLFSEFEKIYSQKNRNPIGRLQKFSVEGIKDDKLNLDIKFVNDESIESSENIPTPDKIVKIIEENLESAKSAIRKFQESLNIVN